MAHSVTGKNVSAWKSRCKTAALLVVLVLLGQSGDVPAGQFERSWSEDPRRGGLHCVILSRADSYHLYKNLGNLIRPQLNDLSDVELVSEKRGAVVILNRHYCERFFSTDPQDQYVRKANDIYWYDKREFFHESELIPIDQWRTRYIYEKSDGSYVGSELMTPEDERELDRLVGYNAYMLGKSKNDLYQFSDDGYYFDRETQLRWRLMHLPGFDPNVEVHSSDEPSIFSIDESGRHLPRLVPLLRPQKYTVECKKMANGGISCGFARKDESAGTAAPPTDRYSGAIRDISPKFSPLTIGLGRVTINKRLTHGEPFEMKDRYNSEVTDYFLYADFDDPIRPVYFAPGVLLRDQPKGYSKAPRKSDFINEEICLTDCPSDIEWQLSSIRKRIEAHP
ncbi:hypothetical protein ABE493_02355 [Stenotrophomonas terrae]|uniref:hypothetical protein n=1 Tax=Stenotrophomonas terrae TaxID=405446 RepID=UPI003207B228